MRILYYAFLLFAIALSLLLLLHSVGMFAAFVGMFPVALLVLWYVRKIRSDEPVTAEQPSDLIIKQRKVIRKKFWRRVTIATLTGNPYSPVVLNSGHLQLASGSL